MTTEPVTLDQLARLYRARNQANSDLSAALRVKEPQRLMAAKEAATRLNKDYFALLRRYKRQQKSERRAQFRTTAIRFYLDAQAATPPQTGPG